jgi:hypothetical protein
VRFNLNQRSTVEYSDTLLGIACLEDGDQRATGAVWGKLFQVEFSRFLEVGDGLFDSLTLADRANFRAVGNVQVAFFVFAPRPSILYANWYFPASIVFCAICWRSAIVLNGSCLDNRRTIANCVRSMSPSATSAMTFLAAASTFSRACVK